MEVGKLDKRKLKAELLKAMAIEDLVPAVTGWETPHGYLVEVSWTVDEKEAGGTRMEIRGDVCHFLDLRVPESLQARGVYGTMIERLRSVLIKFAGASTVTAVPAGPDSELALRRGGFEWEGGRLVCRIAQKGNRMDEYASWKAGKRKRPSWHEQLG